MKYIVYKTTCLINGKIYIGVHGTENPDVPDGYIGDGIATYFTYFIRHPKWPFQYAVAKYGIENFKRETLFVYDIEQEAYLKEEELVNEEFIARDDTYNIALGGQYIKKISAPVYQFTLDGKLIKKYDSAYQAKEETGIWDSTIRYSAKEHVARNGFLWSWTDSVNPDEYYIKQYKHYFIYDSNGDFVKEFEKARDCLEFLEYDLQNNAALNRATNAQYKLNGYYVTCEKLDKLNVQITVNKSKLNRYDLNGNYIDSFATAREAKEKLNLKLASLSSAIKQKRMCNGYYWTRCDNPPIKIDYCKK